MQQRQKQFAIQNQINAYNKMNYHLKKVEPFKNKTKRTVTEQMKQYTRNQKVSTININNNNNSRKIHKNTIKYDELEFINQEHLNKNIAMATAASQVKIYQNPHNIITGRKNIFDRGNSEKRFKKLDIAQRGKSLKYWKVQKNQNKFLTQIKGFFNTFLLEDDGCNCGPDCCKYALLKWINVPDQLIEKNYVKLLTIAYRDESEKISKYLKADSISNQKHQYQNFQSKRQKEERQKHKNQIQKDVIRTQTQNQLFHKAQTHQKMQRILMCYTVQDPQVGYVQSMNIVLSGVLYHVREQARTYAICRKLFHQIRKIYLNDFKQCYKHVDNIIKLIQMHILDLYTHFQQTGVELKVIIFPWVLSLLCVVVPLEQLHLIYVGYVKQNWRFIYKTILSLFVYHKDKLKQMQQCGDILVFLSASNQIQKGKIDWEDIVQFGEQLNEYI